MALNRVVTATSQEAHQQRSSRLGRGAGNLALLSGKQWNSPPAGSVIGLSPVAINSWRPRVVSYALSGSLVRVGALPSRDLAAAVSTSHWCSQAGASHRPGVVDDSLGLVGSPGLADIVYGLDRTDLRPTAHRREHWLKFSSRTLLPFLGNTKNATTAS